MKLGVFGGTFDPVHWAHLVLAQCALDELKLDSILFIPAGEPWRKSHRTVAPAVHRLEMLRLAVAGNDDFAVSDVELRREGPTYTADTLEALAGERLDDSFWFIVGADALADMPNWRDPERIAKHAVLAVAPRPGYEAADVPGVPRDRIVTFAAPLMDISSSDIRDRLARARSARYLLPAAVEEYVRAQGLYGTS